MNIKIVEEKPEVLSDYEKISIAFSVDTVFRVELIENGLGGVDLIEEKISKPFIKDYDAIGGNRISLLGERFDLSNWGIFSAFDGDKRIGGAIIAPETAETTMLEKYNDVACLWDLRVAPEYRGKSVGRQLFAHALKWSRAGNCRLFKVETQNINVPACRFYARQGCRLGSFDFYTYPEGLNEIQLVWYQKLQ